jgi:mRNA-degrading endonuclease toxin of MazEF toxin-antitoxin module
VVRGDVHRIELPGKRGHVHESRRYAVIVQADDLLALSTVVICPTWQRSLSIESGGLEPADDTTRIVIRP